LESFLEEKEIQIDEEKWRRRRIFRERANNKKEMIRLNKCVRRRKREIKNLKPFDSEGSLVFY